MSESQDFHLIDIPHSDGQDTGSGYWPVATETGVTKAAKKTTRDAAEKLPRAKPQMVRLAEDDPRFIEWRVKMGILLKQELSPNPQDGLPWYVQFPRGYWLYEKSKHLWVSGYPVKSKLFKSPQEFGVHLLWLISGSDDDQDCCCIHCNAPKTSSSSDELSIQDMVQQQPVVIPASAVVPVPPQPPKVAAQPAVQAIKAIHSATPTPTSTPTPPVSTTPTPPLLLKIESPNPPRNPTPPIQTPEPVQSLVAFSQNISPLFFRTGEMVWFSVAPSWRIGLIARSHPTSKQYDILPIGHGLLNNAQLQLKPETALRPFLAFTVPPVSLPDLNNKSFDDAPWETLINAASADSTKREPLLLDASKLAAVKISMSFSLFTRLSDSGDSRKTNYHGIFLGAERVEVGDALRVRTPVDQPNLVPRWADPLVQNGGAFLGLREICTAQDTPGLVFFKGDLYVPLVGDDPALEASGELVAAPDDKLPRALREEAAFRAKFAPNDRWRLALLQSNIVLREQDVRGRFYPSAKLLPVLAHTQPQQLQAELQRGTIRDSARQLNQRTDTFKDGYIGQKRGRLDTVGAAVPHGSANMFAFEPVVQELTINIDAAGRGSG